MCLTTSVHREENNHLKNLGASSSREIPFDGFTKTSLSSHYALKFARGCQRYIYYLLPV